jgi:hypothetical protein
MNRNMTDKIIGVPQSDVEAMVKLYEHLARSEPDDGEGRYLAQEYRFKANELRNLLVPVNFTPPQADANWPVLDKPAKVGAARFQAGVSSHLVVEAAQRLHAYEVTPEKEAARIARGKESLTELRERLGLEDGQGAWLQ